MIGVYNPPASILDQSPQIGGAIEFDSSSIQYLNTSTGIALDDCGHPVLCAIDKVTGKQFCRVATVNGQGVNGDTTGAALAALGAIQVKGQANSKLNGWYVPIVSSTVPAAGAPLKVNATGAVAVARLTGASLTGTLGTGSADVEGATAQNIANLL